MLVLVTDGKSEDPVENHAKKLRRAGVEVFVLGAWTRLTSYIYRLLYVIRAVCPSRQRRTTVMSEPRLKAGSLICPG